MITLCNEANEKLKRYIYEKANRAVYIDVCEKYSKGYVTTFIISMQILITKLGVFVAEIDLKKPKVNYCIASINYLCKIVLDNPNLATTFKDIGINVKGNSNKHTVRGTAEIDMQRCVTAYNNLVNSIINKYHLPALTAMIVKKTYPQQDAKQSGSNSSPKLSKSSSNEDRCKASDEHISIEAAIIKGEGVYEKGLFKKEKRLNFNLEFHLHNESELRITEVNAVVKCGFASVEKKIKERITNIDLPFNQFHGKITVTISVTYKLSILKSKILKMSISKNF